MRFCQRQNPEEVSFLDVGSPTWIRTTIHGSKGRCPTVRRSGKIQQKVCSPSLPYGVTIPNCCPIHCRPPRPDWYAEGSACHEAHYSCLHSFGPRRFWAAVFSSHHSQRSFGLQRRRRLPDGELCPTGVMVEEGMAEASGCRTHQRHKWRTPGLKSGPGTGQDWLPR